jgi:hypothetical protein
LSVIENLLQIPEGERLTPGVRIQIEDPGRRPLQIAIQSVEFFRERSDGSFVLKDIISRMEVRLLPVEFTIIAEEIDRGGPERVGEIDRPDARVIPVIDPDPDRVREARLPEFSHGVDVVVLSPG